MKNCNQLKSDLIDNGLEAIRNDPAWSDHLAQCVDCCALLDAYAAIPELLNGLPELSPPDSLAEQTEQLFEPAKQHSSARAWRLGPAATGMATAVVLVAVVGLSRELFRLESPELLGGQQQITLRGRPQQAAEPPAPMDYEGDESTLDQRLGEDQYELTAPGRRGALADVITGPDPDTAADDSETRFQRLGKTEPVLNPNRESARDNKPAQTFAPSTVLNQRQLKSQLEAIDRIRVEEGQHRGDRGAGLSTEY